MINKQNNNDSDEIDTYNRITILPEEYPRIYCSICEADFDTNKPSSHRIDRTAIEIETYLKYKRAHMEDY